MALTRCLPAVLFATLACAAQAQTSLYAPSRPSAPSAPAGPTMEFDEAGNPRTPSALGGGTSAMGAGGAPATGTTGPNPRTPTPQILGPGSFNTSTGLENVLNSGTPPVWDRKAGTRKVCPPELENRNNVCVPPMGSILSQ